MYRKNIHLSIFYIHLIRLSGRGGAGAYPSSYWARGGVHPGQIASSSQGHIETNGANNHTCSHSLFRTILETPIYLTCCFWTVGGSQNTRREPTHTRGKHANLEPSCCEATVLTTTPPCSPKKQTFTPNYHDKTCLIFYKHTLGIRSTVCWVAEFELNR